MGDLGIDGWKLAIQLFAFLVFLGILWKKALGPIVAMIDSRTDKIRESMSAAEKMQADLKATATRNEEALVEARKEAQQIVTNARAASENMLNKAREDAGKQADEYLARAQASLRSETEQARLQLRQELAGLAVSAAGKIVRKEWSGAWSPCRRIRRIVCSPRRRASTSEGDHAPRSPQAVTAREAPSARLTTRGHGREPSDRRALRSDAHGGQAERGEEGACASASSRTS